MITSDVIIIGAGVAGSSAAFHIASLGHKVILLEKNESEIYKPCGGGIASSVQNLFPFSLNEAVDQTINRVDFTWCLEDPVRANLPGSSPFWIVQRSKLDKLLINEAIKAGSEFIRPFYVSEIKRDPEYWRVYSNQGEFLDSKILIIADGSNSPWTRKYKLGPKSTHVASTTSIHLEGKGLLKEGTARFEFGLVENGFAWAFPLSDSVNIGVGTFLGKNDHNIDNILERFLPDLGFNSNDGKRQQAPLRVWNGHNPLHGNKIIAIGDAASLCDPFLAEGIRPALISGHEAANTINKFLQGEIKDLSLYTHNIREKWGNSMSWGRRIAQVFYRFPKIGYQLGIKRPTAPQRIAEILSGNMGYGDIANRAIKRLLFNKVK